jgi:restriction system protein
MGDKVPNVGDLLNPLLLAIRELGGSGTIEEITAKVIEALRPTKEVAEKLHTGSTKKTELEYRLDWARTRLKWVGLLENSRRGVWSLTAKGRETDRVDPRVVMKAVRTSSRSPEADGPSASLPSDLETPDYTDNWKEQTLRIIQSMDPAAFERLCRRLLLESGFSNVNITGRAGDQGLDGHGFIVMNNLISFPVYFQCKRYQGSVGSKIVRDFRGAMEGRSVHGILITTGRFTTDARSEATRPGARTIDLLDGYELAEKLKDLRLGIAVRERTIEDITVDPAWFAGI